MQVRKYANSDLTRGYLEILEYISTANFTGRTWDCFLRALF